MKQTRNLINIKKSHVHFRFGASEMSLSHFLTSHRKREPRRCRKGISWRRRIHRVQSRLSLVLCFAPAFDFRLLNLINFF